MMRARPTSRGFLLEGDTPTARWRVLLDDAGHAVESSLDRKDAPAANAPRPDGMHPCPKCPPPPPEGPAPGAGPAEAPGFRGGGPGAALALVIRVITLGLLKPCGPCDCRRKKLDRLGWRGLWRVRQVLCVLLCDCRRP